MQKRIVAAVCVSIGSVIGLPDAASADAVLRWNLNAGRAAEAACLAPEGNALAESRMYAMVTRPCTTR